MKTALNGHVGHALLWAAAIIASALMQAPTELVVVLLPALASAALYMPERGRGGEATAAKEHPHA